MGCTSSKLEHVGDVIMVPAKIRPMIVRKVEEIKRHARNSNSRGGSVTSRKELLLKDNSGYHSCDLFYVGCSSSSRGSSTSSIDDKHALPAQEHYYCEEFKDAVESLSETPLPGSPNGELLEEEEEEKVAAEFLAWSEMRAKSKKYTEEEDINGESEEEDDDDVGQRQICPGSPSFRVYYIESLGSIKKDDGDDGSSFDDKIIENAKQRETKGSDMMISEEEAVKHKRGIMRTMRKQGGKLKRVIMSKKPRPTTAATKFLKKRITPSQSNV